MKVTGVKEVNTLRGQGLGLQSKLFPFLAMLSKSRQSINKHVLFCLLCASTVDTAVNRIVRDLSSKSLCASEKRFKNVNK